MSESRRKKALYLLLVAAVAFGIYNFSIPGNRYVPGDVKQSEGQNQVVVASSAPIQSRADMSALDSAQWGRNPFSWSSRPHPQPRHSKAMAPAVTNPIWRLSAILYITSHPVAIVNGKTVKTGDVVDRAQVVKIDRNTVTLRYNGSEFDIRTSKG